MIVKLKDLDALAQKIISDYSDYRIFVLNGEMGAGKTTFSKSLCASLGAIDDVTSPTFAIANIYQINSGGEIYHFDFYRLQNHQEALDIGLDDYLYSGNYCFMEWANLIIDYIPKPYVKISILHTDNNEMRDIIVEIILD